MTQEASKALADEPSQAAMEAAVELEIEGCIGCITTRGLAQKLDKIATSLRAPQPGTPSREEVARALVENLIASTDVNGKPIISGVNTAVSAILSLTPAQTTEPVAWQPIETAPKTGCVLIAGGTFESSMSMAGECTFVGPTIASYDEWNKLWQGDNAGGHDEFYWHKPTHWMPLPKFPAAAPSAVVPDSADARFDQLALDLVNKIEALSADLHPTQRKARAQVLIIEAMQSLAPPDSAGIKQVEIERETKQALHYLSAIKVRLELLYENSKQDARLLEHLSDEVDWIDAEIDRLRALSSSIPEEYPGGGRRTADIVTLAEDIIEHGDNIAYPSRSSSQYVRNVMRSLVEAYRDMESRALHAETVLAEHEAISESQEPPAKWLDEALRGLARDLLADPKTPWIGDRDPKQHICWTAADRLAALALPDRADK